MSPKEKVSLAFINFSRKHFRNTWVHKIPLTSRIYQKLFLTTFKGADRDIIFRGRPFSVPTSDTTIVPSMISGEYESFELDILKKLLNKGDTVLDVGANIGVYSVEAAAAVGKKGKVFAFEPVPANQAMLRRNLKLNNISNAVVVTTAVGSKKSNIKLYLAENSIGTHSVGAVSKNHINVPVTPIDSFVEDNGLNVNLIKMDIEGYEGFAVEGSRKTISKQKPILLVEFSAKHLVRCGYDPDKHAKNLIKLYKYCYLIEERNRSLQRITDPSHISHLLNDNLLLSSEEISI